MTGDEIARDTRRKVWVVSSCVQGMRVTERKEQQQVELLEEVETIALCPIGKGVVDLDPGVGLGGPGDNRSLSGTMRRGRSYTPAHYMSQQMLAQALTLPPGARLGPPGTGALLCGSDSEEHL